MDDNMTAPADGTEEEKPKMPEGDAPEGETPAAPVEGDSANM